jgi:hypothetical protein
VNGNDKHSRLLDMDTIKAVKSFIERALDAKTIIIIKLIKIIKLMLNYRQNVFINLQKVNKSRAP